MRKLYLFVFILASIVLKGNCQNIEPYVSIGYGSYELDDIKTLFKSIYKNRISLPLQTTDYFPEYFNYVAGVKTKLKEEFIQIGVSSSYASSGARVNLTDYSGSYSLDFLTDVFAFSGEVGVSLKKFNKLDVYLCNEMGYSMSNYDIKESFVLYENENLAELNLNSVSFYAEPNIEVTMHINKIGLFMDLGYLIDFKGNIHQENNRNQAIYIDDKKAKSDWSGYRLSFGVKYLLNI